MRKLLALLLFVIGCGGDTITREEAKEQTRRHLDEMYRDGTAP